MRSVWSGAVTFGLVNIPVQLVVAVRENRLHLNYLRKDDFCPIAYKKVCRKTGEEVPHSEIVKGYQYRKGDYMVLREEDFERADPERSTAIVIDRFVDRRDIDFRHMVKPYYVTPEKKSLHVYKLFREALAKSGKVGVGKFALRDREHLVMLSVVEEALVLELMRFSAEIQSLEGLGLPPRGGVPRDQLDLALELIGKMEGRFRPEEYRDEYAEKVRALVDAKLRGKKVKGAPARSRARGVPDIMAQLKKSLAASGR